mgnify:CR=1 FL=1
MARIVGGALAGIVITVIFGFIPVVHFAAALFGGLIAGNIAGKGAGHGALAGLIMALIAGGGIFLLGGALGGIFGRIIESLGVVIFILWGIEGMVGGAIAGSQSRPREVIVRKK